ncbi:MAG: PAS domain-containing protein, partial [Planctomycetaceae bacterium]
MTFEISDPRATSRLINLLLADPRTFIYCVDIRTQRFVYASRGARRVFGRSPEELCAPDAPQASEFLTEPSEGDDGAEATMGRVLRVRHKDGSLRWLQAREVVYETDSLGRVTLMLGLCQDVTDGRAIK